METSGVVELRQLVQTERFVVPWTNPLGCVDGARLQRSSDFATSQGLCVGAQTVQCLTTQTWHTNVQTFKVSSAVDFFVEPTAGLYA